MPVFEDVTQTLVEPRLDLIEPERSPRWVGRYSIGNTLTRSLCHLAAHDGQYTRLLRGSGDGVLYTAIAAADASATADVDSSGNLAVAIHDGTTQLSVGNVQNPSGTDDGLAIRDYYGKQRYNLLSGGTAKCQLTDPDGDVANVTGNGELIAVINASQTEVAGGQAGSAAMADHHLYVTGYELKEIYSILLDVYDDTNHALRTVAV